MSKFFVGEQVDNAADNHESGPVGGVFSAVDDNAVDKEGYSALLFFAEEKTSGSSPLGPAHHKVCGGDAA